MATIAEMLIRLGMDASGLKQGAGQAKQELSGLEKSMKGVEQAGKTMSSIGNALTLGVTTPVMAAGAAVASFVVGAAGMTKVRSAFDGIAKSAGSSGDAVLLAMQKGSQGMMSNIDIMKNFNLASQLVSEDFAMKLPEAFGYLGKVSAATGESMDYMLNSLIKGVGRLSPLILDNLGIQVDLTAAYEAYGATLGKSVEEMNKAEKQTAIMNATMTALAENTAAMPDNFGSTTAALKATFQNAKDAIGETLLPVLGEVTSSLTGAINKIVEMTTEGGNLYPALQSIGSGFSDIVSKIGGFVDKLSELDPVWVSTISNIVLFLAALGPVLSITGKLTSGIATLVPKLANMAVTMGITGTASLAGAAAIAGIAVALAAVAVAVVHFINVSDQLAEAVGEVKASSIEAGDSFEEYVAKVNAAADANNTGKLSLSEYRAQNVSLRADLDKLVISQQLTRKSANSMFNRYIDGFMTLEDLQRVIYDLNTEQQQNATFSQKMASGYQQMKDAVQGATAATEAQIEAAKELQEAQEAQNLEQLQAVKSITNNMGNMISYAQNYDQIQKQINEKMTLMSQIDVNGDGIADVGNKAKGTQEDLNNLTGEVEALNGALETMAAQAALSMLQATIAIGGVTEAESKLFFDTAVAMGQMTQKGADAAYQSYSDSIKLMNLLELDPKTGEISVDNYDAMMAILAIDNMTIAEKIAAIEAVLSGEATVKSTLDGLAKNRVATITVNTVAGDVTPMLRAEGGDVTRKNVYIVGEKGPEIFVPNTDGQIIPNHKIGDYASSLNSGGAGSVVTNNYNLSMPTTANAGDVKMAFELMEAWGT